jgi:hypothetical protein
MNKYMLATGTTWRQQVFVRVQWAWFTAPAMLVMLSLLFCSLTIVQSSIQRDKYTVWKSSSLSTMLALSEKMHGDIGGLRSALENETVIATTRAQLGKNEEGKWRLNGVAD